MLPSLLILWLEIWGFKKDIFQTRNACSFTLQRSSWKYFQSYWNLSKQNVLWRFVTRDLTRFFYSFQLFHNDPEFTITVFCAVQLVGLTSTCTNPVLYAFFNENLRKEFEFLIECICPTAFSRSRLHTNMNGATRYGNSVYVNSYKKCRG